MPLEVFRLAESNRAAKTRSFSVTHTHPDITSAGMPGEGLIIVLDIMLELQ
jgi:hypothetical protein